MSLKKYDGLQSEIFVPITPTPVWAPVKKKLKDMTVAIVTAAGVHLKSDKPFNLAGDTSYRVVPSTATDDELMVSHGGYDLLRILRQTCIHVWVVVETLKSLLKKLVQKLPKNYWMNM